MFITKLKLLYTQKNRDIQYRGNSLNYNQTFKLVFDLENISTTPLQRIETFSKTGLFVRKSKAEIHLVVKWSGIKMPFEY